MTSSDTDVREGSDVSLRCQASGSPPPQIKWRREDEKDITIGVKKGGQSEARPPVFRVLKQVWYSFIDPLQKR
ncbi:hypothetical protein TNCV_4751321 [Trichonephila clavipes]|nr:hypothetical protein TNCV_4751321 [Trichonephila clavipes]